MNWVIKNYAKQTTQQFKSNDKRVREDKSNTWFLGGSANRAYVHASKLTGLKDSTKQASKASTTLTMDFQGVNKPLQQEIILNLLTQVYSNTYNLSIWFYKKDYKNFSHTISLNTNESSICVN